MFYNSKFNGNLSNRNINSVSDMKNFGILYDIDINNISNFNRYKTAISEFNRRNKN